MSINWTLKKIKVSDLKEFKGNPRNLTEKGMADLKKSITKFGIAEPIVCNTDLEIIGGHARKKTLEDLKIKEVDCYIPDKKLSKQEVKELNIRLNKNIAGTWDFDILANEFDSLDLKEWGFTEDFIVDEFAEYTNDNCIYPIVPQYSEKYDALIIMSKNEIDTTRLREICGFKHAKDKNNKIGLTNIITAKEFFKKWDAK